MTNETMQELAEAAREARWEAEDDYYDSLPSSDELYDDPSEPQPAYEPVAYEQPAFYREYLERLSKRGEGLYLDEPPF